MKRFLMKRVCCAFIYEFYKIPTICLKSTVIVYGQCHYDLCTFIAEYCCAKNAVKNSIKTVLFFYNNNELLINRFKLFKI